MQSSLTDKTESPWGPQTNRLLCRPPIVFPWRNDFLKSIVPFTGLLPPQNVAPTHTPGRVPGAQHVLTTQTSPAPQWALSLHSASCSHCVSPSTQNPVPSGVLAQTQVLPGPQATKVSQVFPSQPLAAQAPFLQMPEGHYIAEGIYQLSHLSRLF